MAVLKVPGELMPAFWQFKRDFEQVAAQWIARGEESEASVSVAREGLRRYLAERADPDEYGVSREERLRHVFEFWHELVQQVCPRGIAVIPVLGPAAETRAADRMWISRTKGK